MLDIPAGTAAGPELRMPIQEVAAYAKRRGLSGATLAKLGAVSGTVFFPSLGRRTPAIIFPYVVEGREAGRKAVSVEEKAFIATTGFQPALLNLDRLVKAEPGDIYFTEGEIDAASLIEAGIPLERVTSVPGGASKAPVGDSEAVVKISLREARHYVFPYIDQAMRLGLGRHQRFIWCGDMDEVGLAFRQRVAQMLGPGKFWYVDWPEGCKDANDYLRSDGPDAVKDLVLNGAKQWPIEGIYRLRELPEPPTLEIWDTGFRSWDRRIHMANRTLSVVTGQPGHGKTLLTAQIWYQIARQYDLVIAVATFETRAKPEYRRILRTLYVGKPEHKLTNEEMFEADIWIDQHYLWIEHPDRQASFDWLLDIAEVAVVRDHAKIIQVDPWNRLESMRDWREREDEYISRCLKAAHAFAQDMNVHFQIVAHPSKMVGERRGRSEPGLEDIAGAKGWDSIPDQGLVVHRPVLFDERGARRTEAFVTHAKSRYPALGFTCRLPVVFDLATGRFIDGVPVGEE